MKKKLTVFCFTDIHNQQAMLDFPTTLRGSLVKATGLAVKEFGLADIAIVGGDNISDYPHWERSCSLPKKNFLDIKNKIHNCVSNTVKDGKVLYVAGNNDLMLGDIGTAENEPYNTTDFYDFMDASFGELSSSEKLVIKSKEKPNELYWGAFHYVVNGVDFIGLNIHPDTAFNSHEGYYDDATLIWVKKKLNEIDPEGRKPIFIVGHLSAIYYYNDGELKETMRNGNRELFYDVFKGHKNAFYLYGHEHGERACYKEYSSGAVLHIDKNAMPINRNLEQLDSTEKEYSYSFVHMGGLRPFSQDLFVEDGIMGYGGLETKQYYPSTGTPKLAQYLVFEIYEDRAIFYMRNAGDMNGYSIEDNLQPYTIYF